jgi:hypothetical protein
MSLRQLDQRSSKRRFRARGVMELYFDRQSLAECLTPQTECALSRSVISRAQTRSQRSGRRTGERLQPRIPLRYLFPRDTRSPACFLSISLFPDREISDA